MIISEILMISVGLGMDAMAVSICKGLAMKEMKWKKALIIGLYFGIFQALMPAIGYHFGIKFGKFVGNISQWISFFLLFIVGLNMIKEGKNKEEKAMNEITDFKTMIPLSIATSIDALIIGTSIALLNYKIIRPITIIGITTFIMAIVGVKLGNIFKNKIDDKAEIFGGIILIIIGIKIIITHYL